MGLLVASLALIGRLDAGRAMEQVEVGPDGGQHPGQPLQERGPADPSSPLPVEPGNQGKQAAAQVGW